jgi:DNA-binding NtrC family response regulator
MKALLDAIEPATRESSPLLLRGEPGTGVRDVAWLVHAASERATGPFVAPPTVTSDTVPGALADARHGSLVVEIADDATARLASALRARAHADANLDVRLIFTASPSIALDEEIAPRVVVVPPLRERIEDVPLLAERLAGRPLAASTLSALQAHRWPGNLDELAAMVRAVTSQAASDRSTSGEFRLPVRREPVLLVLADGTSRRVSVFRVAHEAAEAILESDLPFLPVESGGAVHLYARRAIAAITRSGADVVSNDPLARHVPVVVHLQSGAQLRGELRYAAPHGSARAIDHLNAPVRTFAVYQGDEVHHVAKEHVLYVEESR